MTEARRAASWLIHFFKPAAAFVPLTCSLSNADFHDVKSLCGFSGIARGERRGCFVLVAACRLSFEEISLSALISRWPKSMLVMATEDAMVRVPQVSVVLAMLLFS